jgi:hypothetical protein
MVERVTLGERGDRFTFFGQRPTGDTTRRRSGSSPSLCVWISVRSRRYS